MLTLALACLGIFGVVSYGVALRTKEIGIRVALGAQQPALLRAIVRQVLTPVGIGVVIGLVLAIPAGMVLRSEPFYLENADPIAFAAALAVFACGRRGGGVVAGVPGAAQQSGRRATAFVRLRLGLTVRAGDDFAADHRHQHFRVAQARLGAGERILAEDHEVRELARLDRSLGPLFHRQPRVVDRRHAQRLLARDALIGAEHAAGDRVARDEVIERPQRRIRHDRRVGSRRHRQLRVEIHLHRRGDARARRAPILHEARPRQIQMVLRGDRQAERLHPRQLIGPADERVLDRPAAIDDRPLGVRLFVGVEDQIDRGVADRVRGDAPVLLD